MNSKTLEGVAVKGEVSPFTLLVKIIDKNGFIEQFQVNADWERIEGALACARLCSDSCKAWRVDELVYCVVYLPVKESEVVL